MKISNNALNVLTAKTFKGTGRAWIVRHLEGTESTGKIVELLNEDIKQEHPITLADFDSRREKIKQSIEKQAGYSDGIIAIGDTDFPPYRGNVKNSDRPIALFYRGDLGLLNRENRNIAVIGLLNPDEETKKTERDVVSKLVDCGATIVSGLALGCDTVAHEQALRSRGKTIAILPGTLNNILPASNKGLAEQIVNNGGLLITEYYQQANSKMEQRGRYQERDRLQVLFSDRVVLTASYAENDSGDSGSRLAMKYAADYSIPRAVMYDPVTDHDNPKYNLNRQLIPMANIINRDNMASVVKEMMQQPSEPAGQTGQPHQPAESAVQADLFSPTL